MKRNISITTFALLFVFLSVIVESVPVPVETGKEFLNGEWRLTVAFTPEEEDQLADFMKEGFTGAGMEAIEVPSNWEMAGFETALYNRPSDSVGFYRKKFRAPETGKGERVMLHFEGVQFAAEAWLNGERLGEHLGSYTGFEFDVTDVIEPDRENLLAVKVTKQRAKGMAFDCNDAWALSGIYRDVYLYRLPAVYLDEVQVETDLDEKYEDARLTVRVAVKNSTEEARTVPVVATLIEPESGERVAVMEKEIETAPGDRGKTILRSEVTNPRKWSAESPFLYRLEVEAGDGDNISTTVYRVGFREVEVDGLMLKVNGVPVKLRGVNRHEISIDRGRALTTEDWLEDIRMMKLGNVNTVRTSHYPPDPEFLDLCDEHGFYVIDEVPFGYGDEYLMFPEYLPLLRDRTLETIGRDRNHPSVIIWSLGNENLWSYAHPKLIDLTHRLDHTRPLLLPRTGFESGGTGDVLPPEVDIVAPHYPRPTGLKTIAVLQENQKGGRPVIMTEYLHSIGRHRYTRQMWDLVWEHESSAGGCVWLWADQGIKREVGDANVYTVGDDTRGKEEDYLFLNRWLDAGHIVDSHGIYGTDGIVNADRTPQPDFYEVKKIYSPIHIIDEELEFEPGQAGIEVALQNRYDFTNLDGKWYDWKFLENGIYTRNGDGKFPAISPHGKGIMKVDVDFPEELREGDVYQLEIISYSATGVPEDAPVDVHRVELKPARYTVKKEDAAPDGGPIEVEDDGSLVRIGNELLTVVFSRESGKIESITRGVTGVVIDGPELNTWRPLRLVEMSQPSFKDYELLDELKSATRKLVDFNLNEKSGESAGALAKVSFQLPESGEFLVTYDYSIYREGKLEIDYTIEPKIGEKNLLELGVKFSFPADFEEMTLFGRGPDTYPMSIKNTITSMLGRMKFKASQPEFEANKTEVRWARIASPDASVRFDLPAEAGYNLRAGREIEDGPATAIYLNPWVKHPSMKNSDPPEDYMVTVKDGDVRTGRVVLSLPAD